jgi:hypothetical protein
MDWNRVWNNFRGRSVPLFLAVALLTFGCSRVVRLGTARSTSPGGVAPDALAQLWVDRGDASRLDLYQGPADPTMVPEPGARFVVLARDTRGFSRGYDLQDASGREWSSKHGLEAQSEVVASRVLWALGYHQPPTFYVERWVKVEGGQPAPGEPSRFRPKQPEIVRGGHWSWYRNPFVDTAPYRGLLVLMRVLNNWDLLDRNNYVYESRRADGTVERRYVVQDLGASLGRTRIVPVSGTRNDVEDFEEQGFIKGVSRDGAVHFDDLGRHDRRLYGVVGVADVRWTCARLERLTPAQWRDAFRAAGYPAPVADRFIRRIQEKVRAGMILQGPEPSVARATP